MITTNLHTTIGVYNIIDTVVKRMKTPEQGRVTRIDNGVTVESTDIPLPQRNGVFELKSIHIYHSSLKSFALQILIL